MKTITWNTLTGEVADFDKLYSKFEKLYKMLESREKTQKQIAYHIRSAEQYQFVAGYYLNQALKYKGCVGSMVATDNLINLPRTMKGYKKAFISQTF